MSVTQLAASFICVKLTQQLQPTCFWIRWRWLLRGYSILFVQMIIFQKKCAIAWMRICLFLVISKLANKRQNALRTAGCSWSPDWAGKPSRSRADSSSNSAANRSAGGGDQQMLMNICKQQKQAEAEPPSAYQLHEGERRWLHSQAQRSLYFSIIGGNIILSILVYASEARLHILSVIWMGLCPAHRKLLLFIIY